MVWTHNAFPVRGLFNEQSAAVGAQIRECGQYSLLVSQQQHMLIANEYRYLVARLGNGIFPSYKNPVAVPDVIQVGRNPRRVV